MQVMEYLGLPSARIKLLMPFVIMRNGIPIIYPSIKETLKTCSMGVSSSVNQIAITFVQIILYNSLTYYGAQTAYGWCFEGNIAAGRSRLRKQSDSI